MNKTYLIAGGTAVVSLAAGATGGYFLAKKKFDETIEGLIAFEVRKTQARYEELLATAQASVEETTAVAVIEDEPLVLEAEDSGEEVITPADQKIIDNANVALVNYQGVKPNPPLDEVVARNIFTDTTGHKPKKKLPPRDAETGKFRPKKSVPAQPKADSSNDDPYKITEEEFLLNDGEYTQQNLLWYANDQTLVDLEDNNEAVDVGRVGEVNLTLFPEERDPNVSPTIFVRNDALQTDYEIRLTLESLTEAMGLGESDSDLEDYEGADEYAYQD